MAKDIVEETDGERLHERKLTTVETQEKNTPEDKGGPLIWMMPLHMQIKKN